LLGEFFGLGVEHTYFILVNIKTALIFVIFYTYRPPVLSKAAQGVRYSLRMVLVNHLFGYTYFLDIYLVIFWLELRGVYELCTLRSKSRDRLNHYLSVMLDWTILQLFHSSTLCLQIIVTVTLNILSTIISCSIGYSVWYIIQPTPGATIFVSFKHRGLYYYA